MLQPLFAIRDMLVEFHAPIIGVNKDQMIRDFRVFCENKAELERKDLQLYRVGSFDTETGKIVPCEPEFITGGWDND